MAEVANVITLGIGPDADIPRFLTAGVGVFSFNGSPSNIITLGIGPVSAIGYFLTSGLGAYTDVITDLIALTLHARADDLTLHTRSASLTVETRE